MCDEYVTLRELKCLLKKLDNALLQPNGQFIINNQQEISQNSNVSFAPFPLINPRDINIVTTDTTKLNITAAGKYVLAYLVHAFLPIGVNSITITPIINGVLQPNYAAEARANPNRSVFANVIQNIFIQVPTANSKIGLVCTYLNQDGSTATPSIGLAGNTIVSYINLKKIL